MTRAHQLVQHLLEAEPDEVNPREYLDKVDFTKYARSYRIVDHGLEFSDYFRGHGTYAPWEDHATGWADDVFLVVNDALDMLAENGWELSIIEPQIKAELAELNPDKVPTVEKWIAEHYPADENGETPDLEDVSLPQYIVSIDVSQEGEGFDPVTAQPT